MVSINIEYYLPHTQPSYFFVRVQAGFIASYSGFIGLFPQDQIHHKHFWQEYDIDDHCVTSGGAKYGAATLFVMLKLDDNTIEKTEGAVSHAPSTQVWHSDSHSAWLTLSEK